jgi:hypothetical protein
LALGPWVALAFAEVTLTNTVQRVERVTAEDGTVTTRLVAAEKVVRRRNALHDRVPTTKRFRLMPALVITNPIPKTRFTSPIPRSGPHGHHILRRRRQDVWRA